LFVFVLHVIFRQITVPFTQPVRQPCRDIVCIAEGPYETEVDWQEGNGSYKGISVFSNSVCPLDVRVLTANRWEKDGLPVPVVRILGSRGAGDRAEKMAKLKAFSLEDVRTAKEVYVANLALPLQLQLQEKNAKITQLEDAKEDQRFSEGERIGSALERESRATGTSSVKKGAGDWFRKNPKWAIIGLVLVSALVVISIWALVSFNHPPPTSSVGGP
jgi:hypothetical protein